MLLLSNKAQLEAMEAMSGLETARLRGTAASQGAEEVLSRLSRPMESSDNIRPRKGSKQVYRGSKTTGKTGVQPCYRIMCWCL